MPSLQRTPVVNQLLESLPAGVQRTMLAGCETVELGFADVLCAPGETLKSVYFPIGGFISLIMPIDDSAALEVGMVGNEGMLGIPLALGVDVSPVRAVVQGAGAALRMDAAIFRRELERSSVTATQDRQVCLRPVESTRANGSLHALPRGRGSIGALAADDAGPGVRQHVPCHAGVPRLHAWRSPRWHHQGGKFPAGAAAYSLQPRQHHGSRSTRAQGRGVRLLQGRSGFVRSDAGIAGRWDVGEDRRDVHRSPRRYFERAGTRSCRRPAVQTSMVIPRLRRSET